MSIFKAIASVAGIPEDALQNAAALIEQAQTVAQELRTAVTTMQASLDRIERGIRLIATHLVTADDNGVEANGTGNTADNSSPAGNSNGTGTGV